MSPTLDDIYVADTSLVAVPSFYYILLLLFKYKIKFIFKMESDNQEIELRQSFIQPALGERNNHCLKCSMAILLILSWGLSFTAGYYAHSSRLVDDGSGQN